MRYRKNNNSNFISLDLFQKICYLSKGLKKSRFTRSSSSDFSQIIWIEMSSVTSNSKTNHQILKDRIQSAFFIFFCTYLFISWSDFPVLFPGSEQVNEQLHGLILTYKTPRQPNQIQYLIDGVIFQVSEIFKT